MTSDSAHDVYVNGLNSRFDLPGKYRPHWTPTSLVELGSIGRQEDKDWVQTTDAKSNGLGDLGKPDLGPGASMSFAAGEGITIQAALQGSTAKGFEFIGKAAAGVKIHMAHKDSLVVLAPETTYEQLPDERTVAKQMIKAGKSGDLQFGDQVIVGLLRAQSGSVIASEQDGAKVDLTASATIKAGAIDVGDIKGELGIVNDSGMSWSPKFPNGFVLATRALEYTEQGVLWARHPVAVPAGEIALGEDLVMPLD